MRPRQLILAVVMAPVFFFHEAGAQNLLPNPDFEQHSACPTHLSQYNYCTGWNGWARNTPDYFNCGFYNQDFNGTSYATPYSGTGVMGFLGVSYKGGDTYTEGLSAGLVQPLRAGHHYELRFYLAVGSQGIAGLPPLGDDLGFGFYFYNGSSRPQWGGADWAASYFVACNSFIPQVSVAASAVDTYDHYKAFRFCFTPSVDCDSVYVGGMCTPATGSQSFDRSYYFNLDDMTLNEQRDTSLLATLSADSICTHTCIRLSTADTARLDSLNLEAPGASYDLPESLPLRLCYNSAGTYPLSLTLHRQGSCAIASWQDTVLVTDLADPRLPDTTICPQELLEVDLRPYITSRLLWNDGDTAHFKTFSIPGRYSVSLLTNGCSGTAAFTLRIREYCTEEVIVPSAFSPNGDGLNDVFRVISNYPLDNFSMRIYNRWGQCVYYDTHYKAGWNGARADIGTYFYRISYQRPFTQEIIAVKGDVTLLR